MSALVDMMTNTLDPGYAEAAQRRSAVDAAPRRLRPLTVAAAVVAGLLLVTAGVEERRSAPSAARARTDLADQVRQRTSQVSALQQQVSTLSARLAQLRAAGLTGTAAGRQVQNRLTDLQAAAGRVAVTGPAVRVTLADAKQAAQRDNGGQVLDTDLQHVVNALWASGAEAVAVNGQRVTALTSIRSAGAAIVVDFRPVDPPYVVTAIGDPDALEQRFVSSPEAAGLRTYSQAYGLRFVVRSEARATLPAAAAPVLYAATPGPSTRPPGGSS
jgi:uncharacterized protein YlxW (UPF0749 family)